MLVKLTSETNQRKKSDVGSRIFVTEYIVGAQTVETTKTQFSYVLNPRSRRALPGLIKVTEALSVIKTAYASTWQNNYLDLPVFPDNDSTKTAVTKTYAKEAITYGEPDPSASTDRSFMHIMNGAFVVEKLLIEYNLDQIISIADTGATTTTTSTTSTTTP